jgi:hypothetical protein
LTVEPLTVNPTLSASDKTFDGNTSVTLNTSVSGKPGDSLSFNHVSASFDSDSVGDNKTVTLYGVQLQGTDADNYRLASPSLTTLASILALPTPEPEPTPAPEPTPTPTPTPQPVPQPSPFIPVINPSLPNGGGGGGGGGFGFGGISPVDGGGMAASLDNPFQLSTDDPGQCRADNLEALFVALSDTDDLVCDERSRQSMQRTRGALVVGTRDDNLVFLDRNANRVGHDERKLTLRALDGDILPVECDGNATGDVNGKTTNT